MREEYHRKQQEVNRVAVRKVTQQMDEAKIARKAAFKKMCDDVKEEKEGLVAERDEHDPGHDDASAGRSK